MRCALGALLLLGCLATHAAEKSKRPNFLLILSDDQGWSQLSESMHPGVAQARSEYLRTPNIDRLGRQGMRLTSGYSPAPVCTPSRRSILCGTTAARSGGEFKSSWVPAKHITIPLALKRVDSTYRSAHFGKWGRDMNSTPEQCGYDASDGMTGNATPDPTDRDDPKLTGHVSDRTIGFMQDSVRKGRPFFVQASYYAVHLPIDCHKKTLEQYQARGSPDRGYTPAWAAMLQELDSGVGRLLDSLDKLGIADNTYVVFMSDNGGRASMPGGDGKRLASNYPLSGAKHGLYEGGTRVPFMIRGPEVKAGSYCHTPVAGYDLLPTFYDLAGGTAKLPEEVDGVSLRPLLADPEHGVVLRNPDGLIFHQGRRRVAAIRRGDYKLMLFWNRAGEISSRELYKFDPDPREENRNVANKEPDTADGLQELLVAYLKKVGAAMLNEPASVQPPRSGAATRFGGNAGSNGYKSVPSSTGTLCASPLRQ